MNTITSLQPRHHTLSRKILVIDDNNINRQYLHSVLYNEDTELLSASSGQIGLNLLQENVPDVILIDIQMPEMDGFECLSLVKKNFPKYPSLNFAVTGFTDSFGNTTFEQMGFDGLFLKPIKLNHFKLEIENALIKKRLEICENNQKYTISDSQTLDIKTVRELRKYISKSDLLEIYKEFEIDTSIRFNELKVLIHNQNSDKIFNTLHTVKGNAASLGLKSLTLLCEHMELELKDSNTSSLEQNFNQLTSLFDNFVSNYIRIINQQ